MHWSEKLKKIIWWTYYIDVVATDGGRLTITIILLLSISITHGGCV